MNLPFPSVALDVAHIFATQTLSLARIFLSANVIFIRIPDPALTWNKTCRFRLKIRPTWPCRAESPFCEKNLLSASYFIKADNYLLYLCEKLKYPGEALFKSIWSRLSMSVAGNSRIHRVFLRWKSSQFSGILRTRAQLKTKLGGDWLDENTLGKILLPLRITFSESRKRTPTKKSTRKQNQREAQSYVANMLISLYLIFLDMLNCVRFRKTQGKFNNWTWYFSTEVFYLYSLSVF